jgi:thimet oligopeptidase
MRIKMLVLLILVTMMSAITSYSLSSKKSEDAPFWTGTPDAATFEKNMNERLSRAQTALDQMLAVKGKRTIENTLRPYDEIQIHLDAAGSQAGLMEVVHPDKAVREAAERVTQKVSSFGTALSLNRAVYDALSALDVSKADAVTRYYVERTLREFKLAGVDKDGATRARITALRDELVLIGQDFDKNIRGDVRTVTVKNVSELEGLPQDYIARHKPDANGVITLTTDYPDSLPVFTYAKSEDLRQRMYKAYNNRAYPMNIDVLNRMIARRHELANLIGYPNWADYITANKMVGNAKNASDFIDKIVTASDAKARREYASLLKRKQQDVPGATVVNSWEKSYWSELLRRSDYNFDSQQVRPYFSYPNVKKGVLDVTSKLFGVTFKQVQNVPVWAPDVEGWEMFENGKLVGRFYLDMHPRENKYKHAAEFVVRTGVNGRQIPEATLVCNLPGGDAGDPGLMEHDDVVTFFHEFGHLVHELLAGRQQWIGVAGISTERDFVEAPSQMLEEWTWDPKVLASFAKHYKTGEPIPAELVKQMKRASEFGKALGVRRQMVYAKLSLSIYDRDPKAVNTDTMVKSLQEQYEPFPFVEDTHWQTAFGHLDGYSAVYYTYMWSLVIAKDMFSQFDKSNLLAPGGAATRYRTRVLARGGSAPASVLVSDFLGRPFNFKAYEEWLNEEGD